MANGLQTDSGRKREEKEERGNAILTTQYILDADGNPVPEPDVLTWGRWFEKAERHIGNDELPGDVTVSTVFLGLDHGWRSEKPVLWETMIFGGEHDQYQEQYTSREEAVKGHQRALELVKGS